MDTEELLLFLTSCEVEDAFEYDDPVVSKVAKFCDEDVLDSWLLPCAIWDRKSLVEIAFDLKNRSKLSNLDSIEFKKLSNFSTKTSSADLEIDPKSPGIDPRREDVVSCTIDCVVDMILRTNHEKVN